MSFAGTVTAESVVASSSFTAALANFNDLAAFSVLATNGNIGTCEFGPEGGVTVDGSGVYAGGGVVSAGSGVFTALTFNGQPVQVDVSGYLFI